MATSPFFTDPFNPYQQPLPNQTGSFSSAGSNTLGAIGSGLITTAGKVGGALSTANQLLNPFGAIPITYGSGTMARSTPQSTVAPFSLADALTPRAPQGTISNTQPTQPVANQGVSTGQMYGPFQPPFQPVGSVASVTTQTPSVVPPTNIPQPVPGSVAALSLPDGLMEEYNMYNEEALRQAALRDGAFDAPKTQQDYLKLYQDRINAINTMYQDMIQQSRINNAPIYKAREQQGRLSSVQGGIVGNPMAQAQMSDITAANQREQAAAEALLIAQQRQEINSILGKVDDAVMRAQERFDEAKSEGGKAYTEAIKSKNATRRAILGDILEDIAGKEVSEEDIKALSSKLNLSPDYIKNEITRANEEYAGRKAQAEQEALSKQVDMEYKQAQTAKTLAETAQVGKLSPYETEKIAIDWYKAKNPSTSGSTTSKAESFGKIASLTYPIRQADGTMKSSIIPDTDGVPFIADGYLTPEGWSELVRLGEQEGIKRDELLEGFKDRLSPYSLKNYGLTPTDIKKIQGELPVEE